MASKQEIIKGFINLGLRDKAVEVHSSLSSFGRVDGGAEAVVRALLEVCDTALAPTFSSIGRTVPPKDDRPKHNGTDYRYYDRIPPAENLASLSPDPCCAVSCHQDFLTTKYAAE